MFSELKKMLMLHKYFKPAENHKNDKLNLFKIPKLLSEIKLKY